MIATIGGGFYPSGYSMVMFPDQATAMAVGTELSDADGDAEVFFLTPAAILSQITPTVSDADDPLPSAGTEGATVRAYSKLAKEGHHALLVKTPNEEAADRMMEVVRRFPYSIAQRYRMLVIEDL
ncbi:hypothetical protein [Variovorax saccharolyticus]|uniref:hypothetical protein n=1 Tax=Variovorax saccharolyticus TaxID=3053516 RepID=UPI002578A217|nr:MULTISPECIES: hypothetical protein [unclassified Variovorax]MDM0021937.1 hypothetical protein [Variovorax sp. J22R187]MDM0028314.1 hypothetical protein [Variovorax sp. J31P216]